MGSWVATTPHGSGAWPPRTLQDKDRLRKKVGTRQGQFLTALSPDPLGLGHLMETEESEKTWRPMTQHWKEGQFGLDEKGQSLPLLQ